jgi:crotonobetainyl-CoA:carnitine CoA-transferase CaiB-like acyl-CoA transferase
LEQALAAPLCSSRLASAGARVIKIERRSVGDFARRYDAVCHAAESSYFVWVNAHKQSLELDIKAVDDAALLHRILARADVFVQNLLPGAAQRAGFGSRELRARYPQLITCDISGYGLGGKKKKKKATETARTPKSEQQQTDLSSSSSSSISNDIEDIIDYEQMKAYDLLVQGESGLASITGTELGGPGRVGVSLADISAGQSAFAAIQQALYARDNCRNGTRRGAGIHVSLFDSLAECMTVPLMHHDYGTHGAPTRQGLRHPSICPYSVFDTADARQILISVQNERECTLRRL